MKPAPFDYDDPRTVEETLALLAEHGDAAKVLAGGQSLVPLMNFRLVAPERLVDVNGVAELDYVRADGRARPGGGGVARRARGRRARGGRGRRARARARGPGERRPRQRGVSPWPRTRARAGGAAGGGGVTTRRVAIEINGAVYERDVP